MTRQRTPRGFTLVELVLVLTLVAIAAGIAMPRPDPTAFALRTAENQLVADLRQARASAMTRGTHYRLEIVDVVTHRILRMREVAVGVWIQDGPPVVVRKAPPSAHLLATAVGTAFEFNTRGLLVTPAEPVTLTLSQDVTGLTRAVDVWPSGQVIRHGVSS